MAVEGVAGEEKTRRPPRKPPGVQEEPRRKPRREKSLLVESLKSKRFVGGVDETWQNGGEESGR